MESWQQHGEGSSSDSSYSMPLFLTLVPYGSQRIKLDIIPPLAYPLSIQLRFLNINALRVAALLILYVSG